MNDPRPGRGHGAALGLAGSLALHGLLLASALHTAAPPLQPARPTPLTLDLLPAEAATPADTVPAPTARPQPVPPAPQAEDTPPAPAPLAPPPAADTSTADAPAVAADPPAPPASAPPARREAPPPPSAEDWALAARYTLKNSKAYRHSWGQLLRSRMGPAVEGPDQGMVRFRVEIAPDGRLVRLDTLWSTSAVAERLAREALIGLPPGPPTPTGQALVFERTIHFSPFAHDDPPLYRDDCLPDPPAFRNPYAWDGRGAPPAPAPAAAGPGPRPDPQRQAQALADCLRQLPKDSAEAELAHDRRLLEQWRGAGPPP